ncbi:MAG: alpha/beta hydrolase family protein, partial [bacterium]
MTKIQRNYSTLHYLREVHDRIKPLLSFRAQNEKDWQEWREGLKGKLLELLGEFPADRCPLNAEVLERTELEDYIREKVVFESEPGVSVPAYVLIPKGVKADGKARALLCLHGHGRGKIDVVGIAKDN